MNPKAYLESRGLPRQLALLYHLRPHPEGVVIPVCDPWGTEVGFILRSLDNSRGTRYTTLEGGNPRKHALGLHVAKREANKQGVIVVVEGPFDMLSLTAAGIPAVAVMGSMLSRSQAYWISRYTDYAVVCFDRGEMERINAQKAIALLSNYMDCDSREPPEGLKDVGEAWERLENPRRVLKEWLSLR